MVPGAKGHRRLNLQRNPRRIARNPVGIMAAIDKEAPRLDRCQLAAHMGHPIDIRHFGNHEGLATELSRQRVQHLRIGRVRQVKTHLPKPRIVLNLKGANAIRGRVQLLQRRRQGARGAFARQGGQRRPCGLRQARHLKRRRAKGFGQHRQHHLIRRQGKGGRHLHQPRHALNVIALRRQGRRLHPLQRLGQGKGGVVAFKSGLGGEQGHSGLRSCMAGA